MTDILLKIILDLVNNQLISWFTFIVLVLTLLAVIKNTLIANKLQKLSLKQLREMVRKNTFTDYIEHKKEFFNLLTNFEEENSYIFRFKNKELLYQNLFPENGPLDIKFHSQSGLLNDQIKSYNKSIMTMRKLLKDGGGEDNQKFAETLSDFMWVFDVLQVELTKSKHISENYIQYFQTGYYTGTFYIPTDFEIISGGLYAVLKGLSSFCLLPKEKVFVDQLDDYIIEDADDLLKQIYS